MYSISVQDSFSSAHNLRGYQGKCEKLHGHNWKVEAVIRSAKLTSAGMVMDFTEVKKELREILSVLDHGYLNDLPYFKEANPTSEQIATYIFDSLQKAVPALFSITVWESDNSQATYYGALT
jgi:6-pyruvoyltetrahydropterin/6-carboxytetrahydropterin synthase